jgi:hypothetical protein
MNEPKEFLDWDDMTEQDKEYAQNLLNQLNDLFDKYNEKEDPECEDSTLKD